MKQIFLTDGNLALKPIVPSRSFTVIEGACASAQPLYHLVKASMMEGYPNGPEQSHRLACQDMLEGRPQAAHEPTTTQKVAAGVIGTVLFAAFIALTVVLA